MKNKIGGKKTKSMGSKYNTIETPFITKTIDTEYGKVISILGGKSIQIKLLNTDEIVIGILRGNMRNRIWLNIDDIVLVSKRDFTSKTVDIIHKYSPEHVNKLYYLGELNRETDSTDNSQGIVFSESNLSTESILNIDEI